MAAEFAADLVEVEVVTLKEPAGAERYRVLRRAAGEHLPVPCVLLEQRLVSPGIPEPDGLREVLVGALTERGITLPAGASPDGDRGAGR